MELRNAVSKETLRRHLLTPSSAETPLEAGSSLLSCFTSAGSPKPLLQRLSAGGEAMEPCSEKALKSWFDPLEIVFDEAAGTLAVRFPHTFFGIRFFNLFQKLFERKARELWGKNISISYGSGKFVPTPPLPFVQPAPAAEPEGAGGQAPFGEEWTFETFIGNGRHKWALSLARNIATQAAARTAGHPATADGSPAASGLFVLCGPHGTGKTHLLRAVGNELFRTLGDNLYCASLSDLELLYSDKSPLAARQELFAKEALLIDDFQHLRRIPEKPVASLRPQQATPQEKASVPTLREELCLLLDRFVDQGKTVVIAGEGRPRDWAAGRSLSSRLETGMWAELPEPDLDVRLRYAQRQVRQRQLRISREQLQLIAQHCPDIRRLSGMLVRVASHRSLLGELSEQDLLAIVRQGGEEAALTPHVIISIVGERCGFSGKDITGEKRRPDLVQARQIAMFLCRELLGHSYPVIGRVFGGKDHSTVMHGVKKIKSLQKDDRLVHTMVTELTKACLEYRI